MNSTDPWRAMKSNPPYAAMQVPRGSYGRPRVAGELSGKFERRVLPHARGVYRERKGLLAELAPILAPATGGITFSLDLDDATGLLKATVCVDGQCYDASVDLQPAIAAAMHKAAAFHDELHRQPKLLVGALPHTYVGADCGTRVYQNVTQRVLAEIIRAVQDKFGHDSVTANGNVFEIKANDLPPVTLHAVWNAGAASLSISVDAPGFACDEAWSQIDPAMHEILAHAASSAMLLEHVDQAVAAAGDELVDDLVEHHKRVVVGGWWSDVTGAVKKVGRDVEGAAKAAAGTVGHTLNALKGPIGAAASLAAGAAAASIPGVGPLLAPVAKTLAGDLVSAATGSGSVQKVANDAVAAAQQAAQSDPRAAAVLQAAQQAVTSTTAAYHVAQTAASAAAGDPNAQQQLASVAQAAAQGDPAAQQAAQLASQVSSAAQGAAQQLDQGATCAITDATQGATSALADAPADLAAAVTQAVQGWFEELEHKAEGNAGKSDWLRREVERHHHHHPDLRGARAMPVRAAGDPVEELRALAKKVANDFYFDRGVLHIGFVATASGQESMFFPTADQAQAWFQRKVTDPSTLYAAIFEAGDASWPNPAIEQVSKMIASAKVGNGGPTKWTLDWSRNRQIVGDDPYASSFMQRNLRAEGSEQQIGAAHEALAHLRGEATAAAAQMPGDVVGVLREASGNWQLKEFSDSDAADDWFGAVTRSPTGYVYAAYYDKHDPTWPAPLNEAVGGSREASSPGPSIPRGAAEI